MKTRKKSSSEQSGRRVERKAETQEEENTDKVRKELNKSHQMPTCKTVFQVSPSFTKGKELWKKLGKMSLLRNLKCRNFRGFLLSGVLDGARDVYMMQC